MNKGVLLVLGAWACAGSTHGAGGPPPPLPPQRSPAAQAAADNGRPKYTAADVHFISGMIGHHAQAVLMAGWAPSHGASPSVPALCGRVGGAQRDGVAFLQRWLGGAGGGV